LAWLKDGNLSTKSPPKEGETKASESGISPAPNSAEESHIKSGEDGVSRKLLQSSKIQIFADRVRTNARRRRKGRTLTGMIWSSRQQRQRQQQRQGSDARKKMSRRRREAGD